MTTKQIGTSVYANFDTSIFKSNPKIKKSAKELSVIIA